MIGSVGILISVFLPLPVPVDHCNFRCVDPEPLHQKGRNELIVQNPAAALGIVEEFHDIEETIVALKQVRLGTTAHFPNEAPSLD